MQVARAVDESRSDGADRQALLFMGFECEQLSFQFGGLVGIGGGKGCVFGGGRFAGNAVDAGGTAMYDTLQLALSLTSIEQDACAFDVCLAIEFCWYAGMIESPCKVVVDADSFYCALYL